MATMTFTNVPEELHELQMPLVTSANKGFCQSSRRLRSRQEICWIRGLNNNNKGQDHMGSHI